MKKLIVKKSNGQILNGKFNEESELNLCISNCIKNNTWGLPERPELVLDEVTGEMTPTGNTLPAEYTIEITDISEQIELQKQSEEALRFLNQSDFKVLRHLRQKALNLPLSLSEEEYLALEQQRHEASKKVIKV